MSSLANHISRTVGDVENNTHPGEPDNHQPPEPGRFFPKGRPENHQTPDNQKSIHTERPRPGQPGIDPSFHGSSLQIHKREHKRTDHNENGNGFRLHPESSSQSWQQASGSSLNTITNTTSSLPGDLSDPDQSAEMRLPGQMPAPGRLAPFNQGLLHPITTNRLFISCLHQTG